MKPRKHIPERQKKCDPKRDRYIKQPETGKKRQEQHCGYNEFPTLQFINGEAKNITDLAAKLGLKPPYVTRVLGLNNLAPEMIFRMLAGSLRLLIKQYGMSGNAFDLCSESTILFDTWDTLFKIK